MIKKFSALFLLFCVCVTLFGCGGDVAQAQLPKNGYYVYEESSMFYMKLQGQDGVLYVLNQPLPIQLRDGMLYVDGEDSMPYTYENDVFSVQMDNMKLELTYEGETLEEALAAAVPPAGTYAVSSVSLNGNMNLYGAVTSEVLTIAQDGTGTFVFGDRQYAVILRDGVFSVDGETIGYTYYPEEAMLMLLWGKEDADTIVLRPVEAQ